MASSSSSMASSMASSSSSSRSSSRSNSSSLNRSIAAGEFRQRFATLLFSSLRGLSEDTAASLAATCNRASSSAELMQLVVMPLFMLPLQPMISVLLPVSIMPLCRRRRCCCSCVRGCDTVEPAAYATGKIFRPCTGGSSHTTTYTRTEFRRVGDDCLDCATDAAGDDRLRR